METDCGTSRKGVSVLVAVPVFLTMGAVTCTASRVVASAVDGSLACATYAVSRGRVSAIDRTRYLQRIGILMCSGEKTGMG